LSVSFASSSVLESEAYGTPSLVPSSHIYSFGCSHSFDYTFTYGCFRILSLPDIVLDKSQSLQPSVNLVFFCYIWFVLEKYRFDTLHTTGVSDIYYDVNSLENSPDIKLLLDAFKSGCSNLISRKILGIQSS
jgi:hypothetical protein